LVTEEEILEELFIKYGHIIRRFLYLMTNSREEAEDLTQEVFINAYKGLSSYRGDSSYKTWLYTIARHVIIDYYRRKKRKVIGLKDLLVLDQKVKVPDEILDLKESNQILFRAIKELKLPQRDTIILRKVKGYSTAETANILGWTDGKVKTTLHRALTNLKNKLNQDESCYF
jgi:RNA polymerase sigma-70 factor (ECF subfamily)